MNKDIMTQLGFYKEVDSVEKGKCPFCGKVVDVTSFVDERSRKEFEISGLCQACQDETFGKD